jgi:hypothetical protein
VEDASQTTGAASRAGRRELVALALLALAATTTAATISTVALERVPHVTDEIAYAWQGRMFAAGQLSLAPPPQPVLFALENVVANGNVWASSYPPGWPLLLALGWLVDLPWLVGPLMLGAAVLGAWALGATLYDRRTAWLGAIALATSPFALVMGASWMAHAPALAIGTWCLVCLATARRSGTTSRFLHLTAGFLGGLAFATRPFTALTLLAPGVIWTVTGESGARGRLRIIGMLGLGAAPWVAIFLGYHFLVFGDPFTTGYQAKDALQYGSIEAMALPLPDVLGTGVGWYLGALNRHLWGFPWPDLLLLAPLLPSLWRRHRFRGADLLLLATAISLVGAHCLYFYRDVVYAGPRFAFEALAPLSLLLARSLLALDQLVSSWLQRFAGPRRAPSLRRPLLVAAAAALLVFPLGRELPRQIVDHSQWYFAVSPEPLRKMEAAGVGPRALVFVGGSPYVYAAFFLANRLPPESGDRVFVRDFPPLRRAAITYYPRPEIWRVEVTVEQPFPGRPELIQPTGIHWQRLR